MANFGRTPSPAQIAPLPGNADNVAYGQKVNEIIQRVNPSLLSPVQTDAATQAQNGYEYFATSNVTRVILTLPVTATEGSEITFVTKGSAGWKVAEPGA